MKQKEQQNQILENLIMEYIEFTAKFQSEVQINKILNLTIWDIKFIKIYENFNKLWNEELAAANIKNICVYNFLDILQNKTYEYLQQKQKERSNK